MKRKSLDERADEYGAKAMDAVLHAARKRWPRKTVAVYVGCAAGNGWLAGYRAGKAEAMKACGSQS